jgi:ribonuclease HI
MMSFEIHTQGTCSNGRGTWSYSIEYVDYKSCSELIHADHGEVIGTTDIQMKLMAILKALSYIRSMNSIEQIIIKSDCPFCVKCITKEFDCTRDDAFKRDKVTRGFVQYLQEIWWKMSGMNVCFEAESRSDI